jgi:hypothetical protein
MNLIKLKCYTMIDKNWLKKLMDSIHFHKIIEGVDEYFILFYYFILFSFYQPEKYDFDTYTKILWKKWS